MRYKRALQQFHFVHRSECRLMLIHESLMEGNRSTHKKKQRTFRGALTSAQRELNPWFT